MTFDQQPTVAWHPTHLSYCRAHSDWPQTAIPDLVLVTRADPNLSKGLAHLPADLADPPTDLLVTDLPTTTAGEL